MCFMSSFWSWIVLAFIFRSRIHFKLVLYMMWGIGWGSFFLHVVIQLFLSHSLKTLLSSSHWLTLPLWQKSIDHKSEHLCSVLTPHFSLFCQSHTVWLLQLYIVNLESDNLSSLALLFFFKTVLANQGPLYFCIDFRITFSISMFKSLLGLWLRLYWISSLL